MRNEMKIPRALIGHRRRKAKTLHDIPLAIRLIQMRNYDDTGSPH